MKLCNFHFIYHLKSTIIDIELDNNFKFLTGVRNRMKYKRITVITDHDSAELVSCAMFDVGAEGVDIFDCADYKELIKSEVIWDYLDENLLQENETVKVSTVVDACCDSFVAALESRLSEIKSMGGICYGEINEEIIDDTDWANEWKKFYKPIVTPCVTVVPTWINYKPCEGEKIMRLDPGMAFGTGEHATTRMCLELMSAQGKDVIDVGCGSGILGIAAAICGAKSVYMCDIDSQAVEFSRKNAELNGVCAEIEKADLIEGNRRADLILANLTADILMRLAPNLDKHLNEDGEVIVSGIISSRADEVIDCFSSCGFKIKEQMSIDDWCAFKLVK